MNSQRNTWAVYMAVAVTVWIAIIAAIASLLRGTPYLWQLMPILLGGAFVFIILLPTAWRLPPTPPRRR